MARLCHARYADFGQEWLDDINVVKVSRGRPFELGALARWVREETAAAIGGFPLPPVIRHRDPAR